MAYDVVEGKINFGDAVEVKKSPDNWEHKSHQWHDRLDLTATYKPLLHHSLITFITVFKLRTSLFWRPSQVNPGQP